MRLFLIVFSSIYSLQTWAIQLKDYQPYEYEVRFTNPNCEAHAYSTTVRSVGGQRLSAKPANVFCTSEDKRITGELERTPQKKLISWIEDNETKEIFMSYLSFSDSKLRRVLCDAVEDRGLKLTFILDNPNPRLPGTLEPINGEPTNSDLLDLFRSENKLRAASELLSCERGNIKPTLYLRGNQNGLGYAHNKFFIVNPGDREKIKISFSSANLSSGTVLHHENWHFVTTHPESYFAQIHLCMMNGMIQSGLSSRSYSRAINRCRRRIVSEEESDIRVFVAPVDAQTDGMSLLKQKIRSAEKIDLAAHRFSNSELISALRNRLNNRRAVEMRLVVDDDMYWIAKRPRDRLGSNSSQEYRRVQGLVRRGLQVKYMQTNHWYFAIRNDRGEIEKYAPTVHHNKYLLFYEREGRDLKPSGLWTGAGNLTSAAFKRNYENFYYITIPEVLRAFESQYNYKWSDLASEANELPRGNAKPDF